MNSCTSGRGLAWISETVPAKTIRFRESMAIRSEILNAIAFGLHGNPGPYEGTFHGSYTAGVVYTPFIRVAMAARLARAVVMLSSPAASRHISGEVLTVAGGMEGRTIWNEKDIDEDAVRKRARE